jgi:hypothetical protein
MHCVVDVVEDEGVERITVHGVIDPASYEAINFDDYQREVLNDPKINKIIAAMRKGKVIQSIDLGMRGQRIREITEEDGTKSIFLYDPVYCVDGQQRLTAAMRLCKTDPFRTVRLTALVIFDTTPEWELERFTQVNVGQTGLSGVVLFRNTIKNDNIAVQALWDLCFDDPSFPLYQRISWDQYMSAGNLINALGVGKIAGTLHRHAGPGRGSDAQELARGLAIIAHPDNIGVKAFSQNVKTYFELIDWLSPIDHIKKTNSAKTFRQSFMFALAMVLSDHEVFWDETSTVLSIDADTKKKLKSFDLHDSSLEPLLGSSSSKAVAQLYMEIVSHINRGRRTRRLKPRRGINPMGRFIDMVEADELDEDAQ